MPALDGPRTWQTRQLKASRRKEMRLVFVRLFNLAFHQRDTSLLI